MANITNAEVTAALLAFNTAYPDGWFTDYTKTTNVESPQLDDVTDFVIATVEGKETNFGHEIRFFDTVDVPREHVMVPFTAEDEIDPVEAANRDLLGIEAENLRSNGQAQTGNRTYADGSECPEYNWAPYDAYVKAYGCPPRDHAMLRVWAAQQTQH